MLDSQIESKSENDENLFHVIIIDGTWAQASGIYFTNKILQDLKQVINEDELFSLPKKDN